MELIETNKTANPFYNNYVFSNFDTKRHLIKWWQYPFLWLLPTHVQLSGDYVFHFKQLNGRVYLLKYEKSTWSQDEEVRDRNPPPRF